jgi:RNA-binding protein 26
MTRSRMELALLRLLAIPNGGGRPHERPTVVSSSPTSWPTELPCSRRGGRPGVFGGEVQRFHPERRDKTLVVEKIPEDKLSLDAVNSWFKRFGTVTNVAVDAATAKALVSFSTHEEAHAAWKTEDAVFGNRFVKVFWHRPMEGQGLAGQRALAASAPIVASVVARGQVQTTPTTDAVPAEPSSSAPVPGPLARKRSPTTPSNRLRRHWRRGRNYSSSRSLSRRCSWIS